MDDRFISGDSSARNICNEKEIKTINKLTKKLRVLYSKIDRSAFTESERIELDGAFSALLKLQTKAVKNAKHLKAFIQAVNGFIVACAPHYAKQCSHPRFVSFLKAIDLIKADKIKEAKELLTELYKDVQESTEKLSSRGSTEEFLVMGVLEKAIKSHYPRSPEEIECYAALELILCLKKNSTQSMLHRLFKLHMQDCIKGSVWEKAMRKEYRLVRKSAHSIRAATPQVPDAMHKALGVKES